MNHDCPQPEERLDAYLDDRLEADDRVAFERTLVDRPDLARQVETQRAIDAAMRRTMRVPPESELRPLAERAVASTYVTTGARRRVTHRLPFAGGPLALAASIALLLTGALMIWNVTRPERRPNPYGPLPRMTIAEVYEAEIDAGFRPRVVCRDAAEFSMWFENRFRQGLALDPPEGHTALGLGYSNTITPRSIHVLAEADGDRILLFIDRADKDTRGAPVAGDGLHVHRAVVDALVIYELSPRAEARFLPYFRTP